MTQDEASQRSAADAFPHTRWSLILAGKAGGGARDDAYQELARGYAEPIRSYLRCALRRSPDQADDLAQSFFAWSLASGFLAKADPQRGRFRAFLKVALRNFVLEESRKARALARGGGATTGSLTDEDGFERDLVDADAATPDAVLDRAWRAALVQRAVDRLARELESDGRAAVFAVFKDYVLEPEDGVDYAAVAARHGLTTVDVSNYLQRSRARFRALLRAEVMETVRDPSALEDELGWLFAKDVS